MKYHYYNGGEVGLKNAYFDGKNIEFRTNDMDHWLKVIPCEPGEYCCSRVSNEKYHFRVEVEVQQQSGILYHIEGGFYIDHVDPNHPGVNLLITLEDGEISNVMYTGV